MRKEQIADVRLAIKCRLPVVALVLILAAALPKRSAVPRNRPVATQRKTPTMLLAVAATSASAALQVTISHLIPSFLLMIRQASKRKFSRWLARQSLELPPQFLATSFHERNPQALSLFRRCKNAPFSRDLRVDSEIDRIAAR